MHRLLILISYVLLLLAYVGYEVRDNIPGSLLAIVGIAVTITFLCSPIFLILTIMGFSTSRNIVVNAGYFVLSATHLFIVGAIIFKLWPQLMGI